MQTYDTGTSFPVLCDRKEIKSEILDVRGRDFFSVFVWYYVLPVSIPRCADPMSHYLWAHMYTICSSLHRILGR